MNFIEYLVEKYKDDERWVTIFPAGKKKKGIKVLIKKKDGEVLAGMGGNFNGVRISDIHKLTPKPKKPTKKKSPTTKTMKALEQEVSKMTEAEMKAAVEKALDGIQPEDTDPDYIHRELRLSPLKPTKKATEAIKWYTRKGYKDINSLLRGKPVENEEDARSAIEQIDKLMKKSVVKEPFYCYRGLNNPSKELLERFSAAKPGDILDDPGYVSTSTYEEMAFDGKVTMRILVPKGAHALSTVGASLYDEKEALLDRDGQYVVLKNTKQDGLEPGLKTHVLDMLYIPRRK